MHIAAVTEISHTLIPRLEALHGAIEAKVRQGLVQERDGPSFLMLSKVEPGGGGESAQRPLVLRPR